MTRSSDFDGSSEVVQNSYVAVISGNTDSNTSWILNTPNPITIGVTDINFVLYSSVPGVIGGNGICVTSTGNDKIISIKLTSNSGLISDNAGLRVNPSIAGNSLCWNSGVIHVNISGGTLSTALNSKLNTSVFNVYSGATQQILIIGLLTSIFSIYSGNTLTDINNRLLTTVFSNYTGVTIPNTYYNKTCINAYTGATQTAINLKAPLANPTFTGIPAAPTASANTSTTQIATLHMLWDKQQILNH
jgi:hypothetical protein